MSENGPLAVAWISAEAVPYAKVGGLADVCGAVVPMLAAMGHRTVLFLPKYQTISMPGTDPGPVLDFTVSLGEKKVRGKLWATNFPGSRAIVYLVEGGGYFDREGIYADPKTGKPYPDDAERYIFFCRAVVECIKRLDLKLDILHCHDHQTGLIAAYHKRREGALPNLSGSRTIFTIHNLGYQGNYPPPVAVTSGFAEDEFAPLSPIEFHGRFSFMKVGLVYADFLTAVSPGYAREIQTDKAFGRGMERILASRSDRLFGILNGVDYAVWNPRSDGLIAAKYSADRPAAKKRNKEAIFEEAGLPGSRLDLPLVGMISRLADQKGFDLVQKAAAKLMDGDINLVVLGTGDPKYHRLLERLKRKYPDRLALFLTFSERLAHLIEAGADMFLMPSRYEPCGLNQMYSLKYGTVPVVRATGGLADTVVDCDEYPEEGNGFSFEEYSAAAMLDAIGRALTWFHRPRRWRGVMKRGMEADFSWNRAAGAYVDLYRQALRT